MDSNVCSHNLTNQIGSLCSKGDLYGSFVHRNRVISFFPPRLQ